MRALLAILLFAGTASADVSHEASVGSFSRALRSESANAITEDSLAGPAFAYAYRLPVALAPGLELWATGSLAFPMTDGAMFDTLTTELSAMQVTAGARARYALWRHLVVANARVDAGAQRIRLRLVDPSEQALEDAGWGALATGALGIELQPLALASFRLAVRVELGHVATTAVELEPRRVDGDGEMIELDRMAASLGDLDIGGRYASLTVVAQF